MTREPDRHAARPGSRFLAVARLLFSAQTVARVLAPAVADFREELDADGNRRARRFLIRCRWYWSLLVLLAVTPHVVPEIPDPHAVARIPPGSGGSFILLLAVALYAATWQLFGWFVLPSIVFGGVLAYLLRNWHTRHPASAIDARTAGDGRDPEINLSSIHVGGDVAGLMFAIGSVAIVLVGLPGLWWFFGAGAVGSLTLAWARLAWLHRSGHAEPTSITAR